MTLDEELLRKARDASTRWAAAQDQAELAKADYHHAVARLHKQGGSLREVAEALNLSHQRVHQIVSSRPSGPTCDFCGAGPAEVNRLVAGPKMVICDGCAARATPQETAVCDFCGDATKVFGDKAKICKSCADLAISVAI